MITMMTGSFLQAGVLLILIIPWTCQSSAKGGADAGCDEFLRLAGDGRETEALELGRRLLETLAAQIPNSTALPLLTKRLETSQRLLALVEGAVKSSPTTVLQGIVGGDDFGPASAPPRTAASATLPPPAQELYWTHVNAFVGELALTGLPKKQTAFLGRYYDLQIQDSIMRIGRQVAVADPNSLENACYAIVLPLLHLYGRDDAWSQMEPFLALFSPHQLEVLWRFSLLQAERPQASAQIARYQAKVARKEFSPAGWASAAADACVANHRPDLAQQLLHMATDGTKDRNQATELRLTAAVLKGHELLTVPVANSGRGP